MTNYPFTSVDEFRDCEAINAYHELTEKAGMDKDELFKGIAHKSRDNARTPMQWDDSENAGFTSGKPWINVNPNYTRINAKEQVSRADSVFHYYQKLIKLRHESELIVYGHYELLLKDDPDLYVYRRYLDNGQELLVVCNLSENTRSFEIPQQFKNGKIVIQNIERHDIADNTLAPYEAYVIQK